jgi:4-amino-4-deoxy-L-arabinose transferase-like glycosyltransferase
MASPAQHASLAGGSAPVAGGRASVLAGAAIDRVFERLSRWREWAIPAAIVALAAGLRLWSIGHDVPNPFYDAAVRSMGLSWHNFFFGALDPSGQAAIDKPPIDLWLQVGATKLLGFNRTALALPEALGGIAAVAMLYAAIARACGRLAGSIAALAFAVLPIAVLTARSDTMDSVMSALLVGALWAAIVGVQSRRGRWALLSAALVGLAFDVKLLQALVPLPALALLWWGAVGRGAPLRSRLRLATLCAGTLAAVALAWALLASLTPASQRPVPQGSRDGSIFRAMFLYNGLERLTGKSHEPVPYGSSSPAGPLRLLSPASPFYGKLIGFALVATLLLGAIALVLWRRDREHSLWPLAPPRALAATIADPADAGRGVKLLVLSLSVWLGVSYPLFSFMGKLQPRYLEALSPGLAGAFGIAAAFVLARAGRRLPAAARLPVLALALAALALQPLIYSIQLIDTNTTDANPSGSGVQYYRYLHAHRDGARYEAAASTPLAVVGLIAADGQPELFLRTIDGIRVSVPQLRRLVRAGAVRYAIIPNRCRAGHHCTPTSAWTQRNATQVMPGLYRYLPADRLR